MGKLLVFVIAAAATIAFNNCSHVDFAQSTDKASSVDAAGGSNTGTDGGTLPTHDSSQPTADDAIANCQQAAAQNKILSLKTTVTFADTKIETGRSNVCVFADKSQGETSDGNLTMLNDYLRARYEQSQRLDVPPNAVICNVQMSTNKQSFKYDDVFYLTYNDRIIATDLNRSLSNLNYSLVTVAGKQIPLYRYQWGNGGVRGVSFAGVNDKADDYCLGQSEGLSSCSWPLSQQTGEIKFDFDQDLLISVGVTAPAANQRFGFIMTGDNDPTTDCYHEALTFDTTVQYYLK